MTGGGSGGHITPILSVARAINESRPDIELVYIGQKGDNLADVLLSRSSISHRASIRAGKWRRYHSESFWQHLVDLKTLLLNIRDVFYVIIGIFQAYRLMLKYRPNCIFIKGGFVGLPIGIAAKVRGVAYITHDSDAIPGLTNRVVGKWAVLHATGMPKNLYNYPSSKTIYTGIPISSKFRKLDSGQTAQAKEELGYKASDKVIFVVGGGLGSRRLNEVVAEIAPKLLGSHQELRLINVTGKLNISKAQQVYQASLNSSQLSRLKLIELTDELHKYSSAADIVIMRAGATSMAEMAAQGKTCILVPNPLLTSGHQLKNAQAWEIAGAAKIYDEAQPAEQLYNLVNHLLIHPKARAILSKNVTNFAKPNSADNIAKILIDLAENKSPGNK